MPEPSLPPNTTAEQDITTAGQRHINQIWEYTQAYIAILVTTSSVVVGVWATFKGKEVSAFMAFICGTVVGFYFNRTNHSQIGGIGKKPEQPYIGR